MVLTVLENGGLSKPQTLDEDGNLVDYLKVDCKTVRGRNYDTRTRDYRNEEDWTKDYARVRGDIGPFGTFICIQDSNILKFIGESKDIGLLPTSTTKGNYELHTGSSAYCVDNSSLYMYDAETDQWVQQ